MGLCFSSMQPMVSNQENPFSYGRTWAMLKGKPHSWGFNSTLTCRTSTLYSLSMENSEKSRKWLEGCWGEKGWPLLFLSRGWSSVSYFICASKDECSTNEVCLQFYYFWYICKYFLFFHLFTLLQFKSFNEKVLWKLLWNNGLIKVSS